MTGIFKQLLFLFISLSSFQVLAQQTELENETALRIDQIQFVGNEKTNTLYLEQVVSCKKNMEVFHSDIEKDVKQLKNLTSVANASYDIVTIDNRTILQFTVEERITKLPIINFGGIKNNLWFGLGLVENNFKGNGNLLLGYYQNTDGRHTAEVFFRNPRNKSGKWGYSASVRKWSSIEPLFFNEGNVQYLYDNNSLSFSLIRNFGLNQNIELGGSIFRESYLQSEQQDLVSPPGPKSFELTKFLTKFQFSQRNVFYSEFYRKGFSVNATAQNVYSFSDGSFFNSVEVEGKAFLRPRKKLNIASRLRLAASTNNDSPFAPFVADSHVNIRGIGNRIDRGTAQAIFNLEFRYTGIHKKYWATQFVVLSDLGTWRNPGGDFVDLVDRNNFRHFVGGGFRIIYQKVFGATFRLDYSIDIYNLEERGFVIGLGQYF